jgi:hypothetical protein
MHPEQDVKRSRTRITALRLADGQSEPGFVSTLEIATGNANRRPALASFISAVSLANLLSSRLSITDSPYVGSCRNRRRSPNASAERIGKLAAAQACVTICQSRPALASVV